MVDGVGREGTSREQEVHAVAVAVRVAHDGEEAWRRGGAKEDVIYGAADGAESEDERAVVEFGEE